MKGRGKISWLIFNVPNFRFVIYMWHFYYLENVSEGESGQRGRKRGGGGREKLNFLRTERIVFGNKVYQSLR